MPKTAKEVTLEDVQVMGEWNFTLQSDTPLYWIKSGNLDRYLLRFRARSPCTPSTFGIVFHAEADGPGTDGCSFWIERTAGFRNQGEPTKRYLLAGDALESKAVVTRAFPDSRGEEVEEVQMLVQGYSGTIFLQDRKVKINFRLKSMKGSIAFYNTTQAKEAPRDDVSFIGVAITALRRGPMEVAGILGRREKRMLGLEQRAAASAAGEASEALDGEAASAELAVGSEAPPVVAGQGGAAASPRDLASTAGPRARFTEQGASGGGAAAGREAFRATAPALTVARRGAACGGAGGRAGSRGMASTSPGLGGQRGRAQHGSPGGDGGGSRVAAQGGRLRQSASDSVLRRSGGGVCGLSSGSSTKGGGGYLPLATNAHAREQQLMQDVYKRELATAGACKDFIAM